MRILAIRGRNLASIAGDFAIDFEAEPLAGSGIFAITGPTGAGKSTLLDALSLALFGKVPRLSAAPSSATIRVAEDQEIQAGDPRAILRHGTGEGYAEADFAMPGGARYRARWTVTRARQRPTGRMQNPAQDFQRLDTEERLGGTRTETLAAIREVIGLSAEQFGRAVLLAQGDFEAFIRADANDRALLLERLTGSAIYAQLGKRAFEKAAALRADLETIRRDIAAQNGLDDSARAEAEARRDAARTDEQSASAQLDTLGQARLWEQRGIELADRVVAEEGVAAQAEAAVAEAEPRRLALAQDRKAFRFAGDWQALAKAETDRDEAARRLAREQAGLATAQTAEADAGQAESIAATAKSDADEQTAALAPDLNQARALDLQLADSARLCATQETDAAERAKGAASAVQDEASTRQAHDEAEAAHTDHSAWLADHAARQQIAQREDELAESLSAFTTAAAEQSAKAIEREEFESRQQSALLRWSAAQDALAGAETGHAKAADALAKIEAVILSEASIADLTTRRDTLAEIAQMLGNYGNARDSAADTATALAGLTARALQRAERSVDINGILAGLAQDLPVLRARQSEARRACALADAAAEEAAQVLRAGLEDGAPCPVCGSAEHRLSALDALLGEQRLANQRRAQEIDAELATKERQNAEASAEQRQLARQAEDLAKDIAGQQQALAGAETRRDRIAADLAARAAAAGLPSEPEALPPALDAARQAADAELTAQSEVRAAAQAARQAERTALAALDSARTDHTAARDSLEVVTQAIAEIVRAIADLTREGDRLSQTLDHTLAPLGDWRSFADPLATLRAGAQEWRDRSEARDAAALALPARRSAWAAATAALTAATTRAQEAEQALARSRESHTTLMTARGALLGGETAECVAERLAAAVAAATRQLDDARTARQGAAQQRAAAEALVRTAEARRDETASDHAARDTALAASLAAAQLAPDDVARVAALGAEALDAEGEALNALTRKLDERRAVLTRCRDDLTAHEAGHRPALLGAELAEALTAATDLRNDAAARRGEAELTLRRDDEVREHTARLRATLARDTAAAEVWLQLSDLIGDATGSKFRRFAQGLTLDRLLEHANARLVDLKPRYTLERGRGGDMLIQVIDNDMAGEVRGLHNLSGGERFLVSLALALGLAEMSTASGVRIESLFIDEGFGALDPASLGQAVALLEHLHASGRRVGVISHVEELKERIAVKIEVTPTGRGTSEIAVVAG